MMTAYFNLLLQNSLWGTLLFLLIVLFRRFTGDFTKLYVRILWLFLLLVLVLPPLPLGVSFTVRGKTAETGSMFIQNETDAGKAGESGEVLGTKAKEAQEPGEIWDGSVLQGKEREELLYLGTGLKRNGLEADLPPMLVILWAAGAIGLAVKSLAEWALLKKRVANAVRIRKDVWSIRGIHAPFVMPGWPCRIYIPRELEEEGEQLEDILEHERRHIRNQDPWIKCVASLALFLHWFNPFMWIAYRLMNRDMEMYCDECVLQGKTFAQRRRYAQTLLDFACKGQGLSPALYFGESSTKGRIWHVLHAKRPHAFLGLFLLLLVCGCGLSFLTTAAKEPQKAVMDTNRIGLLTELFSGEEALGTEEESGQDWEEEGEHWTRKTVVGTGRAGMEPGIREAELSLMGETEQFALYGRDEGSAMAVRTPECLIYAQVPILSNYQVEPLLLEQDFDQDQEPELAIITYVLHGTGISVRSLFMVDHSQDDSWKIYQYRDQDYMAMLTPYYGTQYTEDGVRFVFKGMTVGIAEQVEQEELEQEYYYYAGSLVDFRFVEEKICLRAEILGYSNVNFSGQYPGHELYAQVRYLGEGNWQLTEVKYGDAGIRETIETALPQYLSGKDIDEYYMVPGLKLSAFGEPGQETAILDISYPLEELVNDELEAYVTVRQDGEDSLQYFHIPMKRISMEDGRSGWKIAGEMDVER
ncbi:MAG: M56 family metallopeptidase [Lachnospiraceae bacterium]|nr:M56 family metallopeptidase [Lachnospiraceae bacterium]